MAIRFVVLFLKSALVQLFQTEGANEMLRMEFPKHGRHASSGNRFVTASTEGAPLQVIVRFAIGLSFVVEEGTTDERLPAILEKSSKLTN